MNWRSVSLRLLMLSCGDFAINIFKSSRMAILRSPTDLLENCVSSWDSIES